MSFKEFKIMKGGGFCLFLNKRLLKHVKAAVLRLSVCKKSYENMSYPAFYQIEVTQENLQCPENHCFFQRNHLSQIEIKTKM